MKSDAELVAELIANSVTIATVESCTGGLIAHRITEVAGSSATFWGSWVTYDNQAKIALGVSADTLKKYGAVSREVATEMARAGWDKVRAAQTAPNSPLIVIATTGIAGPSGGTETKPVGLCWLAVARSPDDIETRRIQAPRELNRSQTKLYFSNAALELPLKRS
ncbi:MAG: CinA family protein [Oligoflexia bacterium]|nr:CinA family protein [Oligoflexia bacterium]